MAVLGYLSPHRVSTALKDNNYKLLVHSSDIICPVLGKTRVIVHALGQYCANIMQIPIDRPNKHEKLNL